MRNLYKTTSLLLIFLLTAALSGSEGYIVTKLRFEGNDTLKSRILKRNLNLQARSPLDIILFWREPPIFSESFLEDDLNHIKVTYQKNGFLDVNVNIDTKSNHEKETIEINFLIEENDPVIIDNITYEVESNDKKNNDNISSLILSEADKFGIVSKDRFTDAKIMALPNKISQLLQENGYPEATADFDITLKDNYQADIKISVYAGHFCSFGDVKVTGNDKLDQKEILKQLSFKKGDEFKISETVKTQRMIQNLGFFKYVTIKSLLNEIKDNHLPIEIIVNELPWWSVQTGIGYGLEERFRISVQIQKLGFLGGSRRAKFTVRHSFLEPYHFNLEMIQPSFLSPQASLKLKPFVLKERETAYELRRTGLSTTFQRELSGFTSTFISYTFERVNLDTGTISDSQYEDLNQDYYNKSSVSNGITIDHSAPSFMPVRGWKASLVNTLSGLKLSSEFHYWQWLIDLRKYQQIIDGTILAGRSKIGMMKPIWNDKTTPIEERFFAGGSNSLRGWERDGVGPVNDEGVAVGGEGYLEFSAELRQLIWKKLYAVAFIDAGNVWEKYDQHDLNDLSASAGLGIRYETPIGPLRLDAAQPINSSQKRIMLHFSIGQAF